VSGRGKAGRRQKNESRKEGREQEIEKAGILFPDKEACSGRKSLLRQKLEREQEKFFT